MNDGHRASRAKEILDNEVFAEAFAETEADIVENWKAESDWRNREALHAQLKALQDVKAKLETFVARGRYHGSDRQR